MSIEHLSLRLPASESYRRRDNSYTVSVAVLARQAWPCVTLAVRDNHAGTTTYAHLGIEEIRSLATRLDEIADYLEGS